MENLSEQNTKNEIEDIYANVLFVADLPNETTNEDLKRIFQDYHFQFATLTNCKNNMTKAQVYFENKDWATKARHELNGYILKPANCTNITKGKPIRICKYEGKGSTKKTNINQSLLVKNIDINMTQKEFYKIFLEYGDIVSGKIEYDESGISKGFGYIYYYNEESAEEAKKNLNRKSFFGKKLDIVNLIPGKKNKNNTITLFVLNLPNEITEDKISDIFGQFGHVSNISVNSRGFAYVSYNNFDSASKCLNQMKSNPISFPGLPNVIVKYASSKEERESNKNFIKNNFDQNDSIQTNLNIQFNLLYYNPEIKNEFDLDKEIRLFIKVIMLMDYSPKEVLIDFESMSGLVIFEKYQDYNLFFKKYQEFCLKQAPIFECLPYEIPIMNNEEQNNNFYQQQDKNLTPFGQGPNDFRMMNNNMQKRNNSFANLNNNRVMMNNGINYMNNMNNMMQKNNGFMINNNKKNIYYKNNNNNPGNIMNNNKFNNSNKINRFKNNNNQNNNRKNIIQRPNIQNTNQKFILSQNYGNSYNININMNPPNMMPMNPFMQQQMMMLANQNNQKLNNGFNNNYNNLRNQLIPMNFQNMNYMNLNQINNNFNENNFKNDMNNKPKNDKDSIDERNLQNLNPSQLLLQFNKPPINIYSPNMLNSKEQEELINEIADSIYEIVYAKYPNEASKITGMIKEKGYEKMNMLLSKREDLNEIIDKAYGMINNSRINNQKENNETK